MRSPAKYWLVFALLAGGATACAGNATFAPASNSAAPSAADRAVEPDVPACQAAKAQPKWMFEGACKTQAVNRRGSKLALPLYRSYAMTVTVPANNARATASVLLADATGNGDVKPYNGKTFPLDKKAFLYGETVNAGKAIAFSKGGTVAMEVVAGQIAADTKSPFPAGPCGVAFLTGKNGNYAWQALPATAKPSSSALRINVSVAHYGSIAAGSAYFAFYCQGALPSPSPSPTATPANCATFHTPPPSSSSATNPAIPLLLTDNSGLGASVYLYLTGDNGQSGSNFAYEYLAKSGQLKKFTSGTSATAFPLACFPGSTGGKGRKFMLPPFSGARLWIAYGSGSNTNPLPIVGTGGSANQGSNFSQPNGYTPPYNTTPFDFFEYTYPSNEINGEITYDTTQVDAAGLPFEIGANAPSNAPPTAGITGANYQSLVNALGSTQWFKGLVLAESFGKRTIVLRLIGAQHGLPVGVPADYFFNQAYAPASSSAASQGYLGYVLSQYKKQSRFYDIKPVSASYPLYCATSDGSSNFIFVPVSATPCPATSPSPMPSASPIDIPASTLMTYSTGNACTAAIFAEQIPYANPNSATAQLWKAVTEDFNRGVMLSASPHPVGLSADQTPPPNSLYYNNAVNNQYAKLLHKYYDAHLTYAFPYDDSTNSGAKFSVPGVTAITIVVHKIPTATSLASPSPAPVPTPTGTYCQPPGTPEPSNARRTR